MTATARLIVHSCFLRDFCGQSIVELRSSPIMIVGTHADLVSEAIIQKTFDYLEAQVSRALDMRLSFLPYAL